MSDVIDSLLIDIETQSKNVDERLEYISIALEELASAVSAIDTSKLSALSSGISQITNAVKGLGSMDGRTMTSFVNKINELSKINSEGLNKVADTFYQMSYAVSGLSNLGENIANIKDLATAIGKLGGKSVEKAVANMPTLANAIAKMFTTLSKLPPVNASTIKMTQALANLASQGQKVGSASKAIQNSLKGLGTQTVQTHKDFLSLIDAFNKIIRFADNIINIFRKLKRAISAVWSTADTAMDYVEIYNYWNVVTDKISKESASKAKDAGEEYAQQLYKSYSSELTSLTRKMTGYRLGDAGELLQTSSVGLGMDASKLMQYQAQIMGITNAVGLLQRTSVKTSKALSMLAGDLSSLTNQDLETVMTNLRSGLIGQSRALYKYGIDITNNTLAQYALANGISKSVSEMSQSEKMYLRMIAILDQSKVAWGDQANTINSVANQYRIFKQQISNLARTIGNLFLPIIQKVLPYINGFIIALQRLLSILGFKLYGGGWLKNLQDGISGGASAIDDMGDGADDLTDSLDDAGKSAKKLKNNLLGIDQLDFLFRCSRKLFRGYP